MLAGLCRQDGRVESQQVRLFGDVFDDIEDLADGDRALAEAGNDRVRLRHGAPDLFHPVDRLTHRTHPTLGRVGHGDSQVVRARGVGLDLCDRGRHLHHR